jgi:hypothetical protein
MEKEKAASELARTLFPQNAFHNGHTIDGKEFSALWKSFEKIAKSQ